MHFAPFVFVFQKPIVKLSNDTFNIIANDLRRAGCNNWNDFDIGVTHQKDIHRRFNPSRCPKNSAIFMQRRRGNVKVIFEMLRKQHPHKHNTPLPTVNNGDTIFDANTYVLCATRLTCKDRVNNTRTIFCSEFT